MSKPTPAHAVDGWNRLTRDEALTLSTSIARDAIEQVLADVSPEDRATIYAGWLALSPEDKQALLVRAFNEEGIEPRELADVSSDRWRTMVTEPPPSSRRHADSERNSLT